MWRRLPWLVLLAGGVVVFLGFGMDPLWPAQDAPPELARRHAAEAEVAGRMYVAGGGLLALGIFWLALRRLMRRRA